MIKTNRSQTWGHKVLPLSFDSCKPKSARRTHRYKVEAASYALFICALEAKRASWLLKRLSLKPPTIALPSQNVAAIKLLDSWLSKPVVEQDEAWEEFKQTVDQYRSPDRKIFT